MLNQTSNKSSNFFRTFPEPISHPFLKDANGPKGGVDKQALIRVQLRNRQVIALETTHENLYAAIKKSAKRAKRTVRRHLSKSRRIQKRRMHDRLDDAGIPTAT